MLFSWSDAMDGPWSRFTVGSHHGHGQLVKDSRGRWYETFFTNSRFGPWPGAWAGIMPVRIDKATDDWQVEMLDEMPK
jgi:hypothetical protein